MKLIKFMITTLMATMFIMSSSLVAFAGGGDDLEAPKVKEIEVPVIEEKNKDVPLTPDGSLNMVDEADLVALANGETVPLEPTIPSETVEPKHLKKTPR